MSILTKDTIALGGSLLAALGLPEVLGRPHL